jgi:hypothetical protein
MAGTTVSDDGVVERAFTVAAGAVGIVPGSAAFAGARRVVRDTMEQAKIEVFRLILGEEHTAQRANRWSTSPSPPPTRAAAGRGRT